MKLQLFLEEYNREQLRTTGHCSSGVGKWEELASEAQVGETEPKWKCAEDIWDIAGPQETENKGRGRGDSTPRKSG